MLYAVACIVHTIQITDTFCSVCMVNSGQKAPNCTQKMPHFENPVPDPDKYMTNIVQTADDIEDDIAYVHCIMYITTLWEGASKFNF